MRGVHHNGQHLAGAGMAFDKSEARCLRSWCHWCLRPPRTPRKSRGHTVNPLIDRLLAEHRNLFRLVDWLGQHRALRAEAFAPDIALMVDALVYLTRFPDVTHHPLEDRIAERLLARNALPAEHAREIEAQHTLLARDGLVLLSDLEGAVRAESMSPELAVDSARLYAERLRHNMMLEELTLFPAAQRHLDADDWAVIGPTVDATPPDPLFREDVEQRFVQLHRAIIAQAGCGC